MCMGGTVERLEIATNAPWSTLKSSGPPVPDEGLAIEIVGHGAEIRPVEGLPAIRDADVNVRISGRTATINVGRGNVEISPGRKLSITNGVFEVPDTFPKAPPAKVALPARRVGAGRRRTPRHGAAARSMRALRSSPSTSRGTLTAQVTFGPPAQRGSRAGVLDLYHQHGRRELRRRAHGHGPEGRGGAAEGERQQPGPLDQRRRQDQRHSGHLDYRKPRDGDADVRVQATLDESARSKLGFDVGGLLNGPVPIKLAGACRRKSAATAGSRSRPT